MNELASAKTAVIIILIILASVLLGDYLGYKIGRWRLATILGVVALAMIIVFFIYAAVVLGW